MKMMMKLGLVLAIYAAAACSSLAVVYKVTKPTIAQRQADDLRDALKEVFPDADGYSAIEGSLPSPDPKISFPEAYLMKRGPAVIGAAVKAQGPGYAGNIVLLAGVGIDNKITRIKILENKETPGLGANAASPSYYVNKKDRITFAGQFAGKSLADPFEAKKDVDAITASTITSRSVAVLIKRAGTAAAAYLGRTGGAR
jgi:Na+-translocating ferredoxin:NAD+ oxidoreductase subunit G